jgi:hypothetical protein
MRSKEFMLSFKSFLINETQVYLAQKVGDILAAIQELRDDSQNMGTRDLTNYSMRIVNLIRRVLHSSWPKEERNNLITLQKVGVALMKAIDEKSDLPATISAVAGTLEKLVADLGVPINKLNPTESPENQSKEEKSTSPTENQPPQPEPAPGPANDKMPPDPQQMASAGQITPPVGGTGQDMAAPPLGGSTGPLDAF